MSLAKKLFSQMDADKTYTIQQIYKLAPNEPETTVRGRIYDHLGKMFEKVSKGVYRVKSSSGAEGLVIQGCGRSLEAINDNSIDAIYADHPWSDDKSLVGGNRNFAKGYCDSLFKYEQKDFDQKYRVLKDGGFLVENLPEESEQNFQYLFEIKIMALKAGFKYYALVPWKKGDFIACTGRKKKNAEYLMIFSKGVARKLRHDVQRGGLMSGTSKMLPIQFDHALGNRKNKKHMAEKPISLFKELLEYITLKSETVLDQFAGSFNLMEAALEIERNCVAYELNSQYVQSYVNDSEEDSNG